jgi:methylthioribose-1-phosphate isomerase
VRTIDWDGSAIQIIDQTLLPHDLVVLELREVVELAEAIESLRVRGAMALGVAGGLGIALSVVRACERKEDVHEAAHTAAKRLRATRPTAVNLGWGIDIALGALPEGEKAVINRAQELLEHDVAANRAVGRRGALLLAELSASKRGGLCILTHCNAGALAGVEWGTALGVVRAAQADGLIREVFTCETRPLLQGSRLTAWELKEMGMPYRIIVDSAGPGLIAAGRVDAVIVGADRIAANGDVANKVGTYAHALAAKRAEIPFLVAAPESTIDLATPSGNYIPIEERSEEEILQMNGFAPSPEGSRALNPAFDVTPADLITAIVTDCRVIRPSLGERPGAPD